MLADPAQLWRWCVSLSLVGLLAAAALGTSACGSTGDPEIGPSQVWAAEADLWMDGLAQAEEERTSAQTVFYAPDAVHDAVMLGDADLHEQGRRNVVQMQMASHMATTTRGSLYLDVDSVARVFTLDYPTWIGPDNGPFASLTHVEITDEGIERMTHLRGTWYVDRESWWKATDEARVAARDADRIASEYMQVWASGDQDAIGRLYTPDAALRDRLRSVSADGHQQIEGLAERSATPIEALTLADTVPASVLASDPFPEPSTAAVFYDMEPDLQGRLSQVWVAIRSEAPCPGASIVSLTLDDEQRVVAERRLPALESLRACDAPADLAAGWWSGRGLPLPFGERVTGSFDTDAGAVEVRNGSPATDALMGWAFDRFATAGLPAPSIASVRFDPLDPRCAGTAGYADWSQGATSILICFDSTGIGPPQSTSDPNAPGEDVAQTPMRGHLLLHELSHAWLVDHADQATRQAFLAHVCLDDWNSSNQDWADRGVEWAAETLTWGMKGTAVSPANLGSPDCRLLTDGFEILTDTAPLTGCPTELDPQ